MEGYLAILGAVSIWAFFNGVLVKGIKTSGVGVGFWTAIFGVIFFIIGFNFEQLTPLSAQQITTLIGLGLFAGLNNACFYTAIKISIPNAALFHYLAPMLVIIWSLTIPIFYEPITSAGILALFVGFIGICIVAAPNLKERNLRLIYLGTGSAIFYSLEIVLSGYASQDLKISPEISAFSKLGFQALVMAGLAFLLKESVKIPSAMDFILLNMGGILLYLSFILYFNGSATVSDLHRGILSYVDRIGAILLGAYIFKEKLTKNVLLGGGLILGAGFLLLL